MTGRKKYRDCNTDTDGIAQSSIPAGKRIDQ